ncbi:hypothetical protein IEO70_06045 [Bacillus sp. AGMB 02131]|uniref:Uncharacterized protein n=1 Tax=Peribacillus faecalis TaxID=2772559 RepID=A0A927CW98_9BACI|nr:hypothetical protein [Peribacillus faecalis]MBD3107922.1 hypothetical protein [Peribacillus faecalis]
MVKPVGFDQKVSMQHLDYVASYSRKTTRKEMYEILDGFLREDIKGTMSRKHAITMLMKIWYLVDDEIVTSRNKILEVFTELTKEERLVAHWGMMLVAYPFFKDVAGEIGRLSQLQENVPSTFINKRMKEYYGDRRRVEVATSAVLMSMKSWGVVCPEKNRNYSLTQKINITNPLLQAFIIQVMLKVLDSKAAQLDIIQNHSVFFPFNYEFNMFELREKEGLAFHRQGLDKLVVEKTSK